MKSVFIFGAGASQHTGAPVMKNFLDRAEELYRRKEIDIENREAFEDIFEAIAELQGIYAKSYLDIDNLEVLFSAIEMAQLVNKLGNRSRDSIARLRNHIITVIVKTLELSVKFKVVKDQQQSFVVPHEDYNNFAEILYHIKDNSTSHNVPDFSFLTFNYDLALDFALNRNRLYLNYCLSGEKHPDTYPYLKLHGSINWGTCQKCQKIIPYETGKVRWNYLLGRDYVLYNLGSNLQNINHCDEPIQGPPVIVPPTWNKTNHHFELTNVWKKAAEELAAAENIFVIGYSLPETDSFFRYLFALGSEGAARIKRFWVFNPDNSVEDRFRRFIGRGIENRFEFKPLKFKDAIPIIESALKQTYLSKGY